MSTAKSLLQFVKTFCEPVDSMFPASVLHPYGFLISDCEVEDDMPEGNAQLKQSRIDNGFLIEKDTSYREIADYLYKDDPKGVLDLIYCLFENSHELMEEVLDWPICKFRISKPKE